jgi:hypothetical protein
VVGQLLYSVTIEPAVQSAGLPVVRSTIEASDKDDALAQAEAAYRRTHPGVARLTMHVMRMRGPQG